MEIRYSITLHPAVVSEDIPRLDASWRRAIRDVVREKLSTRPDLYGKPLRQDLKGCRTLRVGDYRVVFQIQGSMVRIIAIIHRSSEYKNIHKRLS